MTLSRSQPRWLSQTPLWAWAVLGLLVLALVLSAAAPKSYPRGSSYDQSLSGYGQWYAFMQTQQRPIQRWRRPYSQLGGQGQTLVQVADVETAQDPNLESVEVLDWVKQGNTLVQLNWQGEVSGAPFPAELPTPNGPVRIETTRRHRFLAYNHELSPLKDSSGAVVWSQSLQNGQIIRSSYPWLGSGIYGESSLGNFRLLAKLTSQQKGTLWFDEWIHGHRDLSQSALSKPKPESLERYLARQPIAVAAGQGALILLLLLWGQNQRFGAVLPVVPPPRNSSEQYIQALADTLNASGHTEYVLALLGQSLRTRLRTRLGLLDPSISPTGDGAIAAEWAAVTGRPSEELLELLKQANNSSNSNNSKRLQDSELLAWVRQADLILRGLS